MFGYVIADLGRLTEAQRLRYQFGESDCAEPTTIAYEPEPVTPVYK